MNSELKFYLTWSGDISSPGHIDVTAPRVSEGDDRGWTETKSKQSSEYILQVEGLWDTVGCWCADTSSV